MAISLLVLLLGQSAHASLVNARATEGGFFTARSKSEATAGAAAQSERNALEWCARYLETRCDGELDTESMNFRNGRTRVEHCSRNVNRTWSCVTESSVSCVADCAEDN